MKKQTRLKRTLSLTLIILVSTVLCGCAKRIINERDVLDELKHLDYLGYAYEDEIVESISFDKRDTDTKAKTDVIFCTVSSKNDDRSLSRQYRVDARLYSENGWVIESITATKIDEWKDIPLHGVSESEIRKDVIGSQILYDSGYFVNVDQYSSIIIEGQETNLDAGKDTITLDISINENSRLISGKLLLYYLYGNGWYLDKTEGGDAFTSTPNETVTLEEIKNSLVGNYIQINDEQWYINDDAIISIMSREYNEDENREIVEVSVTQNDAILKAYGEIGLEYVYDHDWKNADTYISKEFQTDYISGEKPDINDDSLMKDITSTNIEWQTKDGKQYIEAEKSQISNFKVKNTEYYNKSTKYVKSCSYNLKKPWGSFYIETDVIYEYVGNQWRVSAMSNTSTVESVDITGAWTGTYNDETMNLKLTIQKQGADGSLSALYEFWPVPTNTGGKSGSYKMTGGIDLNTLRVVLKGTEWIEHPDDYVFCDIDALLDSNTNTISGKTISQSWWSSTSKINISK